MNHLKISPLKVSFLLILSLSIFSSFGFAQDQLASYKRAKTLISYGNYNDAMNLLRPYMEGDYGALSKYANYHFARAAFQNNQNELAKSVLMPLAQDASWQQKDDVRYLMALIHFKEGNFQAALTEIESIKDPKIYAEAEKASLKYLENASVSFLVANFSKFQRNQGYRLAMRSQLEKQSILSADERRVLQQLNSSTGSGNTPVTKNPQTLDIAIILPFNYTGVTDISSLGSGNFVLEFYQGLRLALDELKQVGYKINLRSYDTQRDLNRLKLILADSFVTDADLIIGPIYPEETELVSQFAEKNDIPFVNPLSNVDDKIEGLEFAYLFRPSVASIAGRVMEFAGGNSVGKRIAIAYSNATRDEQLAKRVEELANKKGYRIAVTEQVNPRTINGFFDKIRLRNGERADVDLVMILSDDPNLAQSTFGFMEAKNIQTPILVMDSWLYFNFASYEMLENQIFHFIGNNAVDFSNPNLEKFRTSFQERFLSQPPSNAYLGYELLYWVTETIGPGVGFDFRKNLDQRGFQKGRILYGSDFNKSNNNSYVPVLFLENGVLVEK
jgi:hypothetical protein